MSITLITGPMFSCKTYYLIRKINQFKIKGMRVVVITNVIDTRNKKKIISRNGSFVNVDFQVKSLNELDNKLDEYDVIALDEGHFFNESLKDWAEDLANNKNKIVIISGLISNFKREEFSNMVKLVSICDKVKHLRAVCVRCKGKASFTKKKVDDHKLIDVGDSDKYEAVCRKCFFLL